MALAWSIPARAQGPDDAARRAPTEDAAPPPGPETAAAPPPSTAGAEQARAGLPPAGPAAQAPVLDQPRPPPIRVEYAQYGLALTATINSSAGTTCSEARPQPPPQPCILGSGGGLVLRGGYRTAGPWYLGGAYEFTKMDSGNLYRLGIFQQIRAEVRYLPDTGYRATPYATWGVGAVAYGNEWGVETGGALVFAGGGVEVEVSRVALVGLGFVYRPTLIAGWKDTAAIERPPGIAQFFGIELQLEIRTELGRR